jgi:hypothetical protein
MIHARHAAAAIVSGRCEMVLIPNGESGAAMSRKRGERERRIG